MTKKSLSQRLLRKEPFKNLRMLIKDRFLTNYLYIYFGTDSLQISTLRTESEDEHMYTKMMEELTLEAFALEMAAIRINKEGK